jgi:hypothetical protein
MPGSPKIVALSGKVVATHRAKHLLRLPETCRPAELRKFVCSRDGDYIEVDMEGNVCLHAQTSPDGDIPKIVQLDGIVKFMTGPSIGWEKIMPRFPNRPVIYGNGNLRISDLKFFCMQSSIFPVRVPCTTIGENGTQSNHVSMDREGRIHFPDSKIVSDIILPGSMFGHDRVEEVQTLDTVLESLGHEDLQRLTDIIIEKLPSAVLDRLRKYSSVQ